MAARERKSWWIAIGGLGVLLVGGGGEGAGGGGARERGSLAGGGGGDRGGGRGWGGGRGGGRGGVRRVEEWTWTGAGREWIETRWLFGGAMYGLWEWMGEWAPSVLGAGLVAVAFGAVVWPSRGALRSPLGVGIVALGLVAGM